MAGEKKAGECVKILRKEDLVCGECRSECLYRMWAVRRNGARGVPYE